jgi:hypothetical protein
MTVESMPDQGSTFHFVLPRALPPLESAQHPGPITQVPAGYGTFNKFSGAEWTRRTSTHGATSIAP